LDQRKLAANFAMSDLVIAEFLNVARGRRDIVSPPQDHYMSERYASKGKENSSHSQCVAHVKLLLIPAAQE
jgi:hypothetical protein